MLCRTVWLEGFERLPSGLKNTTAQTMTKPFLKMFAGFFNSHYLILSQVRDSRFELLISREEKMRELISVWVANTQLHFWIVNKDCL